MESFFLSTEELLNNFSAQSGAWRHCFYFLSHTQNEYVMMYALSVFEVSAFLGILQLPSMKEWPFSFNAPFYCLVRVHLLHNMHAQLRNGYTWAYAQIMQRTHTLKGSDRTHWSQKVTLSSKVNGSIIGDSAVSLLCYQIVIFHFVSSEINKYTNKLWLC